MEQQIGQYYLLFVGVLGGFSAITGGIIWAVCKLVPEGKGK